MFHICDPDTGTVRGETQQCVHCGAHWIVSPGSMRIRGYCVSCGGHFCGPQCAVCVPQEQMLENLEHGRPLTWRPTRAGVHQSRGVIGTLKKILLG
jgi:hypothetical protein